MARAEIAAAYPVALFGVRVSFSWTCYRYFIGRVSLLFLGNVVIPSNASRWHARSTAAAAVRRSVLCRGGGCHHLVDGCGLSPVWDCSSTLNFLCWGSRAAAAATSSALAAKSPLPSLIEVKHDPTYENHYRCFALVSWRPCQWGAEHLQMLPRAMLSLALMSISWDGSCWPL